MPTTPRPKGGRDDEQRNPLSLSHSCRRRPTNKYKHKYRHKYKHKQQPDQPAAGGTSLSPLHIPPFLMGKLKKSKASPAASAATQNTPDEAILDDLFAQLDAQETNKPPPPGKALGGATRAAPSTSSSDKKITMNGAMSSAKARFKVREVGPIFFSLSTLHSLALFPSILQRMCLNLFIYTYIHIY